MSHIPDQPRSAPLSARVVRPAYSRAEQVSDGVVHVIGVAAAVAAVPVLITLTAFWRGDVTAIVGISIYGGTFIAMLLCSALYNMLPAQRWTPVLRGLDHSAIYFKIAGTYTPFTLLSGWPGAYLLGGLWTAAIAGSSLRILAPERFRPVAIGLYLVMGWAGLFGGWALLQTLSPVVLSLIVIGGLIYTTGVVFYLTDRLPFHTTIWHVFVLVASFVFYAAVLTHVAQTS
ncbi:hemolysin III family protein [Tropicimonas sp. IMCC34011]|uniref:PAQR family membrane homeostasis protein TrhA n=1 Tax=Tropicimonas sp. IMCC34011 TaxID=2248759 RepID=UPI000E2670D7|nr:hemolysin III family protein [Tropicimonas sp. IMCC34011]